MRRGQFSRIELIRPCCNTRDGRTDIRSGREKEKGMSQPMKVEILQWKRTTTEITKGATPLCCYL